MEKDSARHSVLEDLRLTHCIKVASVAVELAIQGHGDEEEEAVLCCIGSDLFLHSKAEQDRITRELYDKERERGKEAEDTPTLQYSLAIDDVAPTVCDCDENSDCAV